MSEPVAAPKQDAVLGMEFELYVRDTAELTDVCMKMSQGLPVRWWQFVPRPDQGGPDEFWVRFEGAKTDLDVIAAGYVSLHQPTAG